MLLAEEKLDLMIFLAFFFKRSFFLASSRSIVMTPSARASSSFLASDALKRFLGPRDA